MDFSKNDIRSPAATPSAHSTAPFGASASNKTNSPDNSKWVRIGAMVLVAAIVILLIALITLVSAGGNDNVKKESTFVDGKKLQAVFLNTGQVYFGNIRTLNTKYFVLSNIYYLQTSGGNANDSSKANTNVSLVKLGCELHEPDDQMVINRDQVTFWENLHDSGQVAKAVATFVKQNPQGQKCADQSTSSSTNSSNNVQRAGNNNGSTPPTNSGGNTTPSNTTTRP